jgi:hypothetical protein
MDDDEGNAPTWDMNAREKGKAGSSSSDGWQVVSNKKAGPSKSSQTQGPAASRPSKQRHRPPGRVSHAKAPPGPRVQPLIEVEPEGPRGHQPPANARATNDSPSKAQKWVGKAEPDVLPPNFVIDIDTDPKALRAMDAWRDHERPRMTIRIPAELAIHDKDSYLRAARVHKTFVFTEHDRPLGGGDLTFGIWGDQADVAATNRDIQILIDEFRGPQKSQRSAKWAKIRSLTDKLRAREEARFEREVTRHRYRQRPLPHHYFGAAGIFHWPVKEYRPEEILGPNCEALDAVRMTCLCHVRFEPARSVFEILGKVDDVKKALMRMRKVCFQIAARQTAPVRLYLLQETDQLRGHVRLEPYNHPATVAGEASFEVGVSPRADGELNSTQQSDDTKEILQRTILRTIPKLHYLRGSIQMRMRFGTFLATLYKKPKGEMYTFDEYTGMTEETQFNGRVTEEHVHPSTHL